jgi:hypothetical protein
VVEKSSRKAFEMRSNLEIMEIQGRPGCGTGELKIETQRYLQINEY